MKKVFSAFLFIVFLLIVYSVSFFIAKKIGLNNSTLFDIYSACFLLFGILGFTYNRLWQKNTIKKKPYILTSIFLFCILFFSLFFRITRQTYDLFKHISTTEGKHWEGRVFQCDPILGHTPVRCASGELTFKFNNTKVHSIPMKFDENGFRISDTASCETKITRPLLLFLGCSFTEGADCFAETTFPHLVGDSLHGTSLNAGVSSYGFSQMLILARKLIPEYKPDYVVVQNSPWLADRASSRFAPTYGLQIPSPYFAKVNDTTTILPPCYSSSCFSLKWEYDKRKNKLFNFISFYFKEGFAVITKDLFHVFWANLRSKAPLNNTSKVEKVFFNEMVQIAGKNNSKLIILNLGDIKYTHNSHRIISGNNNIKFAEADSLLWKTVNFNEHNYQRAYNFWGWTGKDSIIIDRHPTPEAHAIIAKSILQTIKNN